MKTNQAIYSFTAAFLSMSVTTLLCIGCGSDPNGSTGGTGGKGGAAGNTGGNGGSSGSNLGPVVGTLVEGFSGDASVTKFILSNYSGGGEDNLFVTMPDATKLSWDPTEGSPEAGSAKIMAPFSDWNQWVEIQAITQMPPLMWPGKKLHVRLKVGSGLGQDPYSLSGAQALVDTTTAYVQGATFKSIQQNNQWQEFIVDLSSPAITSITGFDATKVITYGIHIASGNGNAAMKPIPAVLYVDSFSIE